MERPHGGGRHLPCRHRSRRPRAHHGTAPGQEARRRAQEDGMRGCTFAPMVVQRCSISSLTLQRLAKNVCAVRGQEDTHGPRSSRHDQGHPPEAAGLRGLPRSLPRVAGQGGPVPGVPAASRGEEDQQEPNLCRGRAAGASRSDQRVRTSPIPFPPRLFTDMQQLA